MSTPLVKIAGKHLSLIDVTRIPDEGPLRVVSILGKARMGKSTFLNAILSRLRRTSTTAFVTQDNDEHCTRGIDYYFCAEQRLLLLDCQGLSLEDSSHDPQLLLFAYLISDIIIFNERMMLQNEALKLMEPICGFMTYIDMEGIQKPQLYFRISDADLVKDPKNNLARVLTRYPDQYQSIRDSIVHLFQPNIGIVKTETLDRSLKHKLQAQNNYMALFEDELLGFGSAIDALLRDLPAGRPAGEWKTRLGKIIHGINHNEKISIDKLDIVKTLGRLEISDYMRTLDPAFFAELSIDAFQSTYDRLVGPRIGVVQNLLADFERRFKSISKEIKDSYFQELTGRLSAPIDLAKRQMMGLAETQINHLVAAASRDSAYPSLHNLNSSFTSKDASFYQSYLVGFKALAEAVEPLYEPVRTKYQNWMKAQIRTLQAAVQECVAIETRDIQGVQHYIQGVLGLFEKGCLQRISALTVEGGVLWQDPKALIDSYVIETTNTLAKDIGMLLTPMSLLVTMSHRTLTVDKVYMPEKRECIVQGNTILHHQYSVTHELLLPLYNRWLEWSRDSSRLAMLCQAVTNRKKEGLFKVAMYEQIAGRIKDVNFIKIENTGQVMTTETFETCYLPLAQRAIQQMNEKGYLIEGDKEEFVRITIVTRLEGAIRSWQSLPWAFAKTHNLEIKADGNIVAYLTFGSHSEAALSHLFKNVHSELLALERAKTTDSLYVWRRDFV
jgi:hypothetical protein